MRNLVKAGLAARISEWFGSDDGLLRILESAEAQTIAHIYAERQLTGDNVAIVWLCARCRQTVRLRQEQPAKLRGATRVLPASV
jgi:hypothetical protein